MLRGLAQFSRCSGSIWSSYQEAHSYLPHIADNWRICQVATYKRLKNTAFVEDDTVKLGEWKYKLKLKVDRPKVEGPPRYTYKSRAHDGVTQFAKYIPWSPASQLLQPKKRKSRMKFLLELMEHYELQQALKTKKFPEFCIGDILEVRMMVPENQRKVYVYKGVCIFINLKGVRSSFKIYNVFPDTGGFVQHIPLYMPDLLDIKVVGHMPATNKSMMDALDDKKQNKYVFQTKIGRPEDPPSFV